MGAQFPFFPPVVKENAHIRILHQIVEPILPGCDLHRESVVDEKQSRSDDRGARVSVNHRELPLIVADQFLRLCPVIHQPQSVVGSDPAAAGGRAGAQAVAPFFFGDLRLVIDQIVHIIPPAGGSR